MGTSRSYLASDVLPNMAEWWEDHSSLRRARNAVNSIAALASRIRKETDHDVGSDEEYKKALADKSDEFALILEVQTAEKPLTFDHQDPRSVQAEHDSHPIRGNGGNGGGTSRQAELPTVVVPIDSDHSRLLELVTGKAIAFLVNEMQAHDL